MFLFFQKLPCCPTRGHFRFLKKSKNHYARLPKTFFKLLVFLIAPHVRLPEKTRIFNFHFGSLREVLT